MSCGGDLDAGTQERIKRAVGAYQRHPQAAKFRKLNERRLERVVKYLTHLDFPSDIDVILEKGVGVRGYSLFLHEYVELLSYKRNRIDGFDLVKRLPRYPEMHACGLLAEHRFLQEFAREMNYSFTLCELVTYNPCGKINDPPDWQVLVRYLPAKIGYEDYYLHPSHTEAVCQFYRSLGY